MADVASARDHAPAATAGAGLSRRPLRDSVEFVLVLAVAAGALAGISVLAIDALLVGLRELAFGTPAAAHLSDAPDLAAWRLLLVPTLGGVLVGVGSALLRRWRPRDVVDAIEANALFGGRMSVGDSAGVVAMTILSGGCGASVGLEAAFTLLGAALSSYLGTRLKLRRDDVRTLVGCGAAGAIAAAFNAPLAGAFYAFELIIGS
jgi:CIC family chloride channel protein